MFDCYFGKYLIMLLQPTENWNSSKRCAAYHHVKRSEQNQYELSDKIMFLHF